MITIVTIIHIIVSLGLIIIVLLQTGRGADIGAVFGGSSATIFGSSGAGNFLTRLTTGFAVVFMLTSLTLGYFSGKNPASSILERAPTSSPQSVPQSTSDPALPPPVTVNPAPSPEAQKGPAQKAPGR
jgi:preprotein translocase subunit SecG